MCDHHLSDGPLVCVRPDPHDAPRGCVYTSTSGVSGYAEPTDEE